MNNIFVLYQGADPNSENKDGVPALMVAAMNIHLDAVEALLEEGAKIGTKVTGRYCAIYDSNIMKLNSNY